MTRGTGELADSCRGDAGVAWITLRGGDRGNPIDAESMRGLLDDLARARLDQVRVVVLRADGWAFSVGGDLKAFAVADDPARRVGQVAELLHEAVLALTSMAAVTLSVVQGPAAGAGFPLAMAADLVLAAEAASFTLGYTALGYTPDGGTSLLSSTLGLHRALQLALLNRTVTAGQACDWGMVADVVPSDRLDQAAAALARTLAEGPGAAQAETKRLLRSVTAAMLPPALDREARSVAVAAASSDGREGVRAFLEKRRPRFAPRTNA
jgi:2-(1,2-epoxy-1,2-dihydrophenyl)acetyl-CoA isomerase